jgi:hypothetical protein
MPVCDCSSHSLDSKYRSKSKCARFGRIVMAMAESGPYLDVKIGGLERSVSDLDGLFNRSARLSIPQDFSPRWPATSSSRL